MNQLIEQIRAHLQKHSRFSFAEIEALIAHRCEDAAHLEKINQALKVLGKQGNCTWIISNEQLITGKEQTP